MTRLIFTGIFDKHPKLKIITHHLGGVVPYFANRIKGTYDQYASRAPKGEEDVTKRLKRHPYEYYKMFYADTSINCFTPALECGLAFFGADRVLFGTDMPYDVESGRKYIRGTIQSIEDIGVASEDKRKMYEGNAKRILNLDHF
jgi:aminocarboxymuconate-semialdehyde decarboxylase